MDAFNCLIEFDILIVPRCTNFSQALTFDDLIRCVDMLLTICFYFLNLIRIQYHKLFATQLFNLVYLLSQLYHLFAPLDYPFPVLFLALLFLFPFLHCLFPIFNHLFVVFLYLDGVLQS